YKFFGTRADRHDKQIDIYCVEPAKQRRAPQEKPKYIKKAVYSLQTSVRTWIIADGRKTRLQT
ncbi:MAG: hypothetical protein PUD43_08825, partial [Clostridia bacterium]|nr:hypothetical protein [Clostridia bacterium]